MAREDLKEGERRGDAIRKPLSALEVLKIKQTSSSGERENHENTQLLL